MTYIKQQVNSAYMRYMCSNFESVDYKNEYKLLRKHFRHKQREKIKLNQKGTQRKLEALFRMNKKDFWREVKKKKKTSVRVNISLDHLKASFSELFNKKIVSSKDDEFMKKIEHEVHEHLNRVSDGCSDYTVNSTELTMIIKSLRNNKAIGFAEISNEMIKYGGDGLTYLIKIVLEKIFQHGQFPHFFNVGKIMPILKDEKLEVDDLNNIRPITISDSLANIFEKVILLEIEKYQSEHKLQFGFKKNSSCNHAIFVLKETANFYIQNNKSVYACAIDASKAFDKVNRLAMMHKLIGKVSDLTWRALYVYYSSSTAYVTSGEIMSTLFRTTVGVKQGGPLSPRLFSIYVEELIDELEKSGFGTHVNGLKTGVIMYADDLIIMSDDKVKLQQMLNIVENYCDKWEIKINAKKTQYIKFGASKNDKRHRLTLDGLRIERVNKIKYLGVWLDGSIKAAEQIDEKVINAISAFNSMRKVGIADKETSAVLKSFLYKVYCRPILYYGVENLKLIKNDEKKIQSTEATLIKYALNLSKTSRTTKLILAMNLEPAAHRIQQIKLNFFKRILKNQFTAELTEKLIEGIGPNNEKRMLKNSLIGFLVQSLGREVLNRDERVDLISQRLGELKETRKESMRCGVVDSIRTCLEQRGEKMDKILKLLVQSFSKKPRADLVTRSRVKKIKLKNNRFHPTHYTLQNMLNFY
jgi:hypothetical protein